MRAAAVLLAVFVPLVGVAQVPTATVVSDTIAVQGLHSILGAEEISPHLSSGLTNTFVVDVTVRIGRRVAARGAARIDLRWEPWDEEFLINWVDLGGTVNRQTAASIEELVAWWENASFGVVTVPPDCQNADPTVTIAVGFLPFSRAESAAARRWLAESLSSSNKEIEGPNVPGGGVEPGSVVNLVVATSIIRESIFEQRWTVTLTGGG